MEDILRDKAQEITRETRARIAQPVMGPDARRICAADRPVSEAVSPWHALQNWCWGIRDKIPHQLSGAVTIDFYFVDYLRVACYHKYMSIKTYLLVAAVFFTLTAALHLTRALYGWPAVIGGVEIPLWASWIALVIGGALAYFGFSLSRKTL